MEEKSNFKKRRETVENSITQKTAAHFRLEKMLIFKRWIVTNLSTLRH